MKQYNKINSLFKRDTNGKFLFDTTKMWGEVSQEEFEYLRDCQWQFTEKVDGTNIRVMFNGENWENTGFPATVLFDGKTDNAQIPATLVNKLQNLFPPDKLEEVFPKMAVCLYGEGYGAKIQKGGGNYIPDGVDFILFDVKIGEWWLQRKDVEDIATKLGIQAVPIIGTGTLDALVRRCYTGFNSQWGDFIAEGIVARPMVELQTRSGARIITKLKWKDFQ
jgi:hypothetical protein